MRLSIREGVLANPVALLPDLQPALRGRGASSGRSTGQRTRPAGRVFRYREGSPWNITENKVHMEVEWRWQMYN